VSYVPHLKNILFDNNIIYIVTLPGCTSNYQRK